MMRDVAIVTLVVGIMLTLLGFKGCFAHEPSSVSASWAPLLIGIALVLFGLLAFKPQLRKHAMHVAAMIALVGLVLGIRGVFLRTFTRTVSSLASYHALIMMIVCGVFLALCVNSFLRARRKRAKERAAAA
jgi:FtsH-binding integral membrane protein